MVINFDDVGSWPSDFLNVVAENRNLFIRHHKEEKLIDRLAESDVAFRIERPENRHKNEYKKILSRLSAILQGHKVMGYHCTRLTDSEIQCIKESGLKVLTDNLIAVRLNDALTEGVLPREAYEHISNSDTLKKSVSDQGQGRRKGMIWFVASKETLKQSGSVYRFFKFWGGEALYNNHEADKKISPYLKSIGVPCIIKASIPFSEGQHPIEYYVENFICRDIFDEIRCSQYSDELNIYVKRNLCFTEILEVITVTDPRFEQLTNYMKWPSERRF